MIEVPEFIMITEGMAYSRSAKRIVRIDLLSETDQQSVGIAPVEWLEQNIGMPGWAEAMVLATLKEQQQIEIDLELEVEKDRRDDEKLRMSDDDWD